MNIILIGLMGSGKTTIAKILNEKLHYKLIELDQYILERIGLDSTENVFNIKQSLWKEEELEACRELSRQNNQIIVASGALVENQLNILYFQENSKNLKIIMLDIDTQSASLRLIQSKEHGFLNHDYDKILTNLENLAFKRNFLNKLYADLVINTANTEPFKVADEILKELKVQ